MAAFNYRDLVRLVSPGSWQFYFQARGIVLPQGADWSDAPEALHKPILQALEALTEPKQNTVYAQLRRVKALAQPRGIQALRNTVALGDTMLEDFEHHASDAERALWALTNWPERFANAESFVRANAQVGGRSWRRLHLPPGQVLHYQPEDIESLRLSLAEAFTPRRGALQASSIRKFFPSALAALLNVVSVRLVSVSSNKRLSAARLVCIFSAKAVLVRC